MNTTQLVNRLRNLSLGIEAARQGFIDKDEVLEFMEEQLLSMVDQIVEEGVEDDDETKD